LIALDKTAPHPQDAIALARKQGWSFCWSERYKEVLMIARNEPWKRAILAKYKEGVAVYTIRETVHVAAMGKDERVASHLVIKDFGGRIE
jgi:hypothetical protein